MIHACLVQTMTLMASFVTVPHIPLDCREALVETLSMVGTASVQGDLTSLVGNVWKRRTGRAQRSTTISWLGTKGFIVGKDEI